MGKEFENMANNRIKTTLLHNDDLRQYTFLLTELEKLS